MESKELITQDCLFPCDNEIWKDIAGYENVYEVSNQGRIRRKPHIQTRKDGHTRFYPQKFVRLITHQSYVYVHLFQNQEERRFSVHRLVAEAFLLNPDNKPCVDHINTIRIDNRAQNLKWVTHQENQKNPITAKRLAEQSRAIKRISSNGDIKEYPTIKDAVNDGFKASCICSCCKLKDRFHKGYIWMYLEDTDIVTFENILQLQKERRQKANAGKRIPVIAISAKDKIVFASLMEAQKYGFNPKFIQKCCKVAGQKYKGYEWRYK